MRSCVDCWNVTSLWSDHHVVLGWLLECDKLVMWPPCGPLLTAGMQQACDLTTIVSCVDWWNATSLFSDHHVVQCWLLECVMIWVSIQHSNEAISLIWLQLISLLISEHAPLLILVLFWNQPVYCSTAMIYRLLRKNIPPPQKKKKIKLFAGNTNHGILNSWSCWMIGSLEPSIPLA